MKTPNLVKERMYLLLAAAGLVAIVFPLEEGSLRELQIIARVLACWYAVLFIYGCALGLDSVFESINNQLSRVDERLGAIQELMWERKSDELDDLLAKRDR